MDDDGPEDEEHFPHTGATDGHFLLAFFEEPLMEFLITRSESHNHVKSLKLWERICLEEGVPGIMKQRRSRARGAGKDRPRKLDTSTEEDLIAENQRLRMEIAYLKKLSTLVLANEQAKRNGRRSSQN